MAHKLVTILAGCCVLTGSLFCLLVQQARKIKFTPTAIDFDAAEEQEGKVLLTVSGAVQNFGPHGISMTGADCVLLDKAQKQMLSVHVVDVLYATPQQVKFKAELDSDPHVRFTLAKVHQTKCMLRGMVDVFNTGIMVPFTLPYGEDAIGAGKTALSVFEANGHVAEVVAPEAKEGYSMDHMYIVQAHVPPSDLAARMRTLISQAPISVKANLEYTENALGAASVRADMDALVRVRNSKSGSLTMSLPVRVRGHADTKKSKQALTHFFSGQGENDVRGHLHPTRNHTSRLVFEARHPLSPLANLFGPQHAMRLRTENSIPGKVADYLVKAGRRLQTAGDMFDLEQIPNFDAEIKASVDMGDVLGVGVEAKLSKTSLSEVVVSFGAKLYTLEGTADATDDSCSDYCQQGATLIEESGSVTFSGIQKSVVCKFAGQAFDQRKEGQKHMVLKKSTKFENDVSVGIFVEEQKITWSLAAGLDENHDRNSYEWVNDEWDTEYEKLELDEKTHKDSAAANKESGANGGWKSKIPMPVSAERRLLRRLLSGGSSYFRRLQNSGTSLLDEKIPFLKEPLRKLREMTPPKVWNEAQAQLEDAWRRLGEASAEAYSFEDECEGDDDESVYDESKKMCTKTEDWGAGIQSKGDLQWGAGLGDVSAKFNLLDDVADKNQMAAEFTLKWRSSASDDVTTHTLTPKINIVLNMASGATTKAVENDIAITVDIAVDESSADKIAFSVENLELDLTCDDETKNCGEEEDKDCCAVAAIEELARGWVNQFGTVSTGVALTYDTSNLLCSGFSAVFALTAEEEGMALDCTVDPCGAGGECSAEIDGEEIRIFTSTVEEQDGGKLWTIVVDPMLTNDTTMNILLLGKENSAASAPWKNSVELSLTASVSNGTDLTVPPQSITVNKIAEDDFMLSGWRKNGYRIEAVLDLDFLGLENSSAVTVGTTWDAKSTAKKISMPVWFSMGDTDVWIPFDWTLTDDYKTESIYFEVPSSLSSMSGMENMSATLPVVWNVAFSEDTSTKKSFMHTVNVGADETEFQYMTVSMDSGEPKKADIVFRMSLPADDDEDDEWKEVASATLTYEDTAEKLTCDFQLAIKDTDIATLSYAAGATKPNADGRRLAVDPGLFTLTVLGGDEGEEDFKAYGEYSVSQPSKTWFEHEVVIDLGISDVPILPIIFWKTKAEAARGGDVCIVGLKCGVDLERMEGMDEGSTAILALAQLNLCPFDATADEKFYKQEYEVALDTVDAISSYDEMAWKQSIADAVPPAADGKKLIDPADLIVSTTFELTTKYSLPAAISREEATTAVASALGVEEGNVAVVITTLRRLQLRRLEAVDVEATVSVRNKQDAETMFVKMDDDDALADIAEAVQRVQGLDAAPVVTVKTRPTAKVTMEVFVPEAVGDAVKTETGGDSVFADAGAVVDTHVDIKAEAGGLTDAEKTKLKASIAVEAGTEEKVDTASMVSSMSSSPASASGGEIAPTVGGTAKKMVSFLMLLLPFVHAVLVA